MLTFPPSLTVIRNQVAEAELLTTVKEWVNKGDRAEGIHVSDLLADRLAYWRWKAPEPLTDREAGLFFVGKVLHAFILTTEGKAVDLSITDEGSQYDEELGLYYSPDRDKDYPEEWKTSRAAYEPREIKDLETYLDQLLTYMVVKRSPEGRLGVLYLNAKDDSGKTHPQFRIFDVSLKPDEIEAMRLEVKKRRDLVADARAQDKPSLLPLCPAWKCHPAQCPYWSRCKPEGRYENAEYVNSRRR